MANFNKVYLMGNLTRDPDVRVTPGGLKIARLGLAVNRVFRTQDGERKEETTFVDIDAFGNQAEIIEKYCQKGRPLFVEGRLRLDQWQDKNTGENRSKLSVVLENFQFIDSRADAGGGDSGSSSPAAARRRAPAASGSSSAPAASSTSSSAADSGNSFEDDDVPF